MISSFTHACIELINKYFLVPLQRLGTVLVGDSDDCSHEACFPGGNTGIELDVYCRVLHAVLEKSKISALTWRGPGKAFTRKPV